MLTEFERGFLLGSLRPRPRKVLALLAVGYERRQICDELCIADKTLRYYLSIIYSTFGTRNHVRLAMIYHGLRFDWDNCPGMLGAFVVDTSHAQD